ncbi:MAG: response regulator [Gammaproteobacteria bacterium]|nr:response regulator [Gammaproteobacteria bacterium]
MAARNLILTIEDDPIIRKSIVAYLGDSGYDMLEALDGQHGLELFREKQPDLVLCDLRMPKMDGLDVLQEITRVSPDTPVIIVSGAGMIDDAIQALKRGAWDYLTKPISDMQVVELAINRAIDKLRLIKENRDYQLKLEHVNRDLSEALVQLQANQQAGRELQARLLPVEHQVFGDLVFRHRLYPAMQCSGDFVDYFAIDKDRIGFYMVDVSGHDIGSAFVTVIVKTLMSQMRDALEDGDDTILAPDRTLQRLNDELFRQNLDKYVAMFYGVVDAAASRMLISNGGYYPHPLLFDDSRIRILNSKGRPVGLFDDARFINSEILLPLDFLLLLVSDGMFELMPDRSNKESYEHLLSNVNSTDMSFEELINVIGMEDASRLTDDLTMLAVSRRTRNVQ